MRWTHRILWPAVMSAALVSTSAWAQNSSVKEARTYFNAGAQAYEAGQFLAAIQAFERAYELAPRDAIVFTIAQAFRRQYYIDKNPAHLKAAIERYRDYLGRVPEGGRRADAAQGLAELEPIAARLAEAEAEAAGEDGANPTPVAIARQTRVMVTSPTEGATISLDGKPSASLPLIAQVEKGQHKIVLSAPGYFDEQREVQAAEGGIIALDLVLREKPGVLDIQVEPDAEISIDGRLVGVSPLSSPLELPAGRHLVAVMKNGREGHSVEVKLERGKRQQLNVELDSTGQRIASNVLFITSATALVTGGVFTALAVRQESKAKDIDAETETGTISRDRLLEYNDTLNRRNDYRTAAVISFGASVALGASGFLLYSFDRPSLRNVSGREQLPSTPEEKPKPASEPSMDLTASPVWSPEMTGAAILGRF